MLKQLFLLLLLFYSLNFFSQKNDLVYVIQDTSIITEIDTVGYEGDKVMLRSEILFIKKINDQDTVYYKPKEIQKKQVTIMIKETNESFYYEPLSKYTYFEFDFNIQYYIIFSAKGFQSKKIVLNTYDVEKYDFGYLFPCEITLYRKKIFSNKYKQQRIPFIKYSHHTKYFEYEMIPISN